VLQTLATLPKPRSVLDAGCGDARLAARVASRIPDASVLGIDIDTNAISFARSYTGAIPNLELRTVGIGNPSVDKLFDMVVCTDVLEHIRKDRSAVDWLAERVALRGYLVIHVPASPQKHVFSSIDAAIAMEVGSGQGPHVREGYSADDLSTLIRNAGLKMVSTATTFHHPIVRLAEDADTLLYQHRARLIKAMLLPLLIVASELERAPSSTRRGYGLLVVARRDNEP